MTANIADLTKAEADRDAQRGYTDADLAEVMDNPEWTDEQLRNAKPFTQVFPDLAASIVRDPAAKKA